jgi:hypothetical protein
MLAAADYLENEMSMTGEYNCDLTQESKAVPDDVGKIIDDLTNVAEGLK